MPDFEEKEHLENTELFKKQRALNVYSFYPSHFGKFEVLSTAAGESIFYTKLESSESLHQFYEYFLTRHQENLLSPIALYQSFKKTRLLGNEDAEERIFTSLLRKKTYYNSKSFKEGLTKLIKEEKEPKYFQFKLLLNQRKTDLAKEVLENKNFPHTDYTNPETGPLLVEHSDLRKTDFSPDSTKILAISSEDRNIAVIWHAETGDVLVNLQEHRKRVTSASFSSDSTKVVTGSDDETVKIWNAQTGAVLFNFDMKDHATLFTSFSPDDTKILASSWRNITKIWNAETRELLYTLKGDDAAVGINSISFSSDSKKVITISSDKTAKIWDLEALRMIED